MDEDLVKDIVGWDIVNWSKALNFWTEHVDTKSRRNNCLELGGREGGLSLWLAINDNNVICSDLETPKEYALELHKKHSCTDRIEYQGIDATNIPIENEFDIVIFKSILGGISRNENDKLKRETIDQIFKCLKPSGKLLFVENLEASSLHQYIRKKFVKWGASWNYLRYDEIEKLFESFENIQYETVGFLAAFGRSEKQRQFLGRIDTIIEKYIPKRKRYVVYGVAEKGNSKTATNTDTWEP